MINFVEKSVDWTNVVGEQILAEQPEHDDRIYPLVVNNSNKPLTLILNVVIPVRLELLHRNGCHRRTQSQANPIMAFQNRDLTNTRYVLPSQ